MHKFYLHTMKVKHRQNDKKIKQVGLHQQSF